jgi:orotate phosphoribosyltransferase
MQGDGEDRRTALGDAAQAILKGAGAFYQDDHVVLTSGRHSAVYVNHDPLFENRIVSDLSQLAGLLACMIIEVVKPEKIPTLVGPMTGGWHLSHWTGHHYRVVCDTAPSIPAEKGENGTFFFKEPKDLVLLEGASCLIIDDVLTTGKSARATKDAIEAAGGIVDGLLVVCDRSGKTAAELGLPNVWSLFSLTAETWEEKDCPMCLAGKRVNMVVGHGAEFMLKMAQRKP